MHKKRISIQAHKSSQEGDKMVLEPQPSGF